MVTESNTMPFLLLMPSYNQAQYIADTVRSVLAQDDPDWELWIVDNSTDSTPETMRQFTDARIRFHHIAERMDPGTCLNWMLERALGRDFSYIHTDNNLHPSYVRRMRAALQADPLALAYCDMRVIDETGRHTHLFRRGDFDLPRLLSADTLGVPFAATAELARQLGGFSAGDVADDVRFCVGAYGLTEYIYVRGPLVDYRLHSNSRTQHAGGDQEIRRTLVHLMPKILPSIRQRGIEPLLAMTEAVQQSLDDVDLYIEDLWYRKLSKHAAPWWDGYPRMEHFFLHGLVDIPSFSSSFAPPPRQLFNRSNGSEINPWTAFRLRKILHGQRHEIRRLLERSRNLLLPWACMKLNATTSEPMRVRINSVDFRTMWAARQLEQELGWQPLLHNVIAPRWLSWNAAEGTEPLLNCADEVSLTTRHGQH